MVPLRDDKFTLHVTWSPQIAEREVLEILPKHVFRKGTDRGVYVACRDREEADLLMAVLNNTPGVGAQFWQPL